MKATKEQIIAEATRRAIERGYGAPPVEHFIVDVTRENWTPPEPVDPDVLAYDKWWASEGVGHGPPQIYLAGARMATEREQERAKVLVKFVERYSGPRAARVLAKYRGEA